VDTPLLHLDRTFDYLVPAQDDLRCVPGCRVRVRFAGRLVDGYVLERSSRTDHEGKLAYLTRVLSAEPVLAPEIALLARSVADRYAGSLADVLRLAVPARHARTEAAPPPARTAARAAPTNPEPGLGRYVGGPALLAALRAGRSPRAVWSALPGASWPSEVAALVDATTTSGRGALVVVPDTRDLARLKHAMPQAVALRADDGPAERYRRFLAVRRGIAHVVVGTRGAVFAPVHELGLILVWDDGDDLHSEPRAPYPHARDVALLRSVQQNAAIVLGAHAVSAESQQLVISGWAHPLRADRDTVRAFAPLVTAAGGEFERSRDAAAEQARLPNLAWRTAKLALENGPVLVQVPRRGYLPALSCASCRTPVRCQHCAGPVALASSHAVPACQWCGRPGAAFTCPVCDGHRLRAAAYGERRTAEELGRSLPGVPVRTSGREQVLASVGPEPALVVATPGAEPVAAGAGYAAVLLLDGWALLGRPDLRAGEEALRRWLNAAALAAPRAPVIVLADPAPPPVQALIRWDPAGHAEREITERTALGFPPAVRMAAVDGQPEAIAALLARAQLPPAAEVLGPVPVPSTSRSRTAGSAEEGRERALIRVPRRDGPALAAALRVGGATRAARKEPGAVRVQLDPIELG